MMADLLTIDPVLLILGAGIATLVLWPARPWHKPEEWREAPIEVRAFMWFSFVTVVVEVVLLGGLSDLRDSLNPYLGRDSAFIYLCGAPIAMSLCRTREIRLRSILLAAIILWIVMTLVRFWSHPQRAGETDPSRMVGPVQLIWTVGIPLIWILVLLSPRVKRYCSVTDVVTT